VPFPAERRLPRCALALLAAAAFLAVRVALLQGQGLWADEYFSLAIATGHSLEHPAAAADPELGDFVEAAAPVPAREHARFLEHDDPPAGSARVVRAVRLSDTSPPLYYLLLWAWTRAFGTSDGALRSLSLLCALATLPLIAFLARRVGGKAAVAPACALFTLLPASVWYSTEGRMYSLLWLEASAVAALTLALRLRGSGRAVPWRLVAWIGAAAAGLLTHYAFLFVFTAIAAASAWSPGRLRRIHLVLATLAVLLLAAACYSQVPEAESRWRVTRGWLELEPSGFGRVTAIAELLWSLFSIRGVWGVALRNDLVHAGVLLVVGVLATRRLRGRWFARRRIAAWLWLCAAWLGPVAVDAVQGTYMVAVPRYALAGLPAAVLIAAVALATLAPRTRAALLAALVLTCAVGVRRAHLDDARIGQPFRELGGELAASIGPDDLVIVHSIPSGVAGLARELARTGAAGRSAPILSWVSQLDGRRAPDDLLGAARGFRRIVHVSIHTVGAADDAADWLERNARLSRRIRRGAARVSFFEPAEGERF
jgi:hypothetical protein